MSLDLRSVTDASLLERFTSQREEGAFAALVERHGPVVFGVCRRLLRHQQDAEDAFQATFLVLVHKAGSIGKHESVGSWLYGVAHRVALKARAVAGRRQAREVALPDAPEAEAAPEAEWRDLQVILDEEVGRLPPRYRGPVVLCYLQGQTTEEAARALGCPRGTVLSRLSRARERLRARLGRRGLVLSAGAVAAALAQGAAAAVPAALVGSTVRAAVAGVVPAQVAALTKGALQAMFLAKLKTTAVVLGACLLAAGVGVFTYGALAAEGAPDKGTAERKKLEGTWSAVALSHGGVEAPAEHIQGMRMVFAGDSFVFRIGEQVITKGTYKLDLAHKPAAIDLAFTEGEHSGETHRGIYELDGDNLKVCTAEQSRERPTEFAAKEGSKHLLITLKRVKP